MRRPFTQLHIHFVWATGDRAPYLTPEMMSVVFKCIKEDCAELGVEVLAIGGTADHIHVLVRIPTTVTIANLVQQMKGSSSHLAKRADSSQAYLRWQGGYGAFTISKAHVPKVIEYIRRQEEHHQAGTTNRELETVWEEIPPHPGDSER